MLILPLPLPHTRGRWRVSPDTVLQAQSNQFSVVRDPNLGGCERRELDVPPQPQVGGPQPCLEGLAEMSTLARAEFL